MDLFAPYSNDDGIVKRLTLYKNLDYSDEIAIWQWYQNREDLLETIEKDFERREIIETYCVGRSDSLYRKYFRRTKKSTNFCYQIFILIYRFDKINGKRRRKDIHLL